MDIISINTTDSDQNAPLPPAQISPLASVDPAAEIGDGSVVGPFCVIGPRAKIGKRNLLLNNVSILGKVQIGDDNRISPGAVIGGEPQDISYSGTETEVIVGDRNVIRENVTFNRASEKEDGTTVIGSDSYVMACSHVAHDCKLGDKIVLGQGSMLGGHVHVHSFATISGCVAVSHYVSIGSYTFIGGSSRALQDITPFMLADGNPARPRCINIVGLKRNGFDRKTIKAIDETFRLLYRSRVGLENAIEILKSKSLLIEELQYCLDFVRNKPGRSSWPWPGKKKERSMIRTNPIRVAVIGAGHLGRIHAKLIQQVPGAELVGIAEPCPSAQRMLIDNYSCEIVSDYRKLTGNVDAAIIATPTRSHFDIAEELLNQDIHLLIENR